MITLLSVLLVIILLSRVLEEWLKIPSTLSIIILAFGFYFFYPDFISFSQEEFDEVLYLMLPIILLPDVLNLSIKELKEHVKEIFYLAFIAVVASIAIATFITPYILSEIKWSLGMLIALFSMLMATDAITVAAIMSKFKLPQRLKIYTESESLFNDVTALIIFYFIALPLLSGDEVSLLSLNLTILKVIFLSLAIGVVTSLTGYIFIKFLRDTLEQFIIIYLVVIISFMLAEHFHISGILAIVTSVITFKLLIQHELYYNHAQKDTNFKNNSLLNKLKIIPAMRKKEYNIYKKEAAFIGVFANAIVFIIIANIINFENLIIYYKEILAVFFITTVIRYISVFTMVKIFSLPTRWSQVLTLAGSKGALAIIMSHSLPNTFEYKDMFVAIVLGIVLLSTFIYTIILMIHINKNQNIYEKDIIIYNPHEQNDDEYVKSFINMIKKDIDTGAYNKPFIEDILSHEIARTQRYKTELSVISFCIENIKQDKENLNLMGEIVSNKSRLNDYFGKMGESKFIILASNTSISGAVTFSQKLLSELKKLQDIQLYFALTQVSDTDTLESIYEKLEDALQRAKSEEGEKIEIEV